MDGGDVITDTPPDDFLATVGDVKEITGNAIAEVIDNQMALAEEVQINEQYEDNTKWLEIQNQIRHQTEQLATMTALLVSTQSAVIQAMQSMTDLIATKAPEPKVEPKVEPTPEPTLESTPEPKAETLSAESNKSAASELADVVDNPANTVLEAAREIEKPVAKVRKRF